MIIRRLRSYLVIICFAFAGICVYSFTHYMTNAPKRERLLREDTQTAAAEITSGSTATSQTTNADMTTVTVSAEEEDSTAALIPTHSTTTERIWKSKTVFYNRVGKCGSRSLMALVSRLSGRNVFTHAGSSDHRTERPDLPGRIAEIKKIATLKVTAAGFYNRHIHYLDFRKHGYEQPIYINMIRDPVDRFSSHYNYLKHGDQFSHVKNPSTDWPDINDCVTQRVGACNNTKFLFYMGMYFCGFDEACNSPTPERVRLAKKHLDEEYAVVGLLEEFENTLKLLEKILPRYFAGAMEDWEKHKEASQKFSSKKLDVLTEESIHKLKTELLADEYEFYHHAKRKFDDLKRKYGIS